MREQIIPPGREIRYRRITDRDAVALLLAMMNKSGAPDLHPGFVGSRTRLWRVWTKPGHPAAPAGSSGIFLPCEQQYPEVH